MSFDLGKAIQSQQYAAPQKDYLWRVQLPDLRTPSAAREWMNRGDARQSSSGVVRLNPINVENEESEFDVERLSYRITNIQIPFFEITTDNQHHANSYWYYAKHNDINSITIEIEEHEDGDTFRYLNEWKNKIMNSNGTYNPPVYYKRDIKFFKLANVKLDLAVHEFKGYFISQISDLSSSYDSNDIMRYSVTFTGDSMRFKHVSPQDAGITNKEQEILRHEIERGSIIDRFSGIDASQGRAIFERVTGGLINSVF